MRILIVEDDQLVLTGLSMILQNQNYVIETAVNGQLAWDLIEAFPYDLIISDIVLPKLDGISLCRKIRSHGYKMPIMLLTGKDNSHDKAIGLDAGADDYVVKPFNEEELTARIRALLRRSGSISLPLLTWGNLTLDPSSCTVTYQRQLLSLTAKEYALMELFMRHNKRVFSCSAILDSLWSFEEIPGEEAVRTHIKCLRQKFKTVGAPPDLIETVYGIGYRLRSPDLSSLPNAQTQQETLAALMDIWHQFKPRVNEQIIIIENAVQALLNKSITQELKQAAEQESHTLAGALGTFGFQTGSQISRCLEKLFQQSKFKANDLKKITELVSELKKEIDADLPTKNLEIMPKNDHPLLLIIESDRALANEIETNANHWGLQTEIVPKLSQARERISQLKPQVVLLDLGVTKNSADSLLMLEEITEKFPDLSVLTLTEKNELTERLKVAKLGGSAFLQKPVSAMQVLAIVNQVLQKKETKEGKIMVVDDDLKILTAIRSILQPWGIQVTTLNEPQKFWETLEAAQPDLLILDIKMPKLNGLELCQIVRNDPIWGNIPVIFLTANTDSNIMKEVFRIGADDFINKPIKGEELVTRIINRLNRTKSLKGLVKNKDYGLFDRPEVNIK